MSKNALRRVERTTVITIVLFGVLLLGIRAVLPEAIEHYANRVLDRAEGYRGSIEDVDVALYAGRYRIEGLVLRSLDDGVESPLVSIESSELSIEWRALLRGSLVGELVLEGAEYTVEAAPPADAETMAQTGTGVDWLERLEELFPLRLNRFELRRGTLLYRDPHSDPEVDLRVDDIAAVGLNWGNIRELDERRYATLALEGQVLGSAHVELGLEADPLSESPDFALDVRARRIDLPELNAFLRAYAGFDASEGILDVFAEIDAAEGRFEGYIKPLVHDLEVLDDESEPLLSNLWEGFIGALAEALENQPEGQQGTKIPIDGEFDQPTVGIWGALGSVLSNAFLEALPMELSREE